MEMQKNQRKLNLVGTKSHACPSLQIGDTTLAVASLQELGRPEAAYGYNFDYSPPLAAIESTCPCTSTVFV